MLFIVPRYLWLNFITTTSTASATFIIYGSISYVFRISSKRVSVPPRLEVRARYTIPKPLPTQECLGGRESVFQPRRGTGRCPNRCLHRRGSDASHVNVNMWRKTCQPPRSCRRTSPLQVIRGGCRVGFSFHASKCGPGNGRSLTCISIMRIDNEKILYVSSFVQVLPRCHNTITTPN